MQYSFKFDAPMHHNTNIRKTKKTTITKVDPALPNQQWFSNIKNAQSLTEKLSKIQQKPSLPKPNQLMPQKESMQSKDPNNQKKEQPKQKIMQKPNDNLSKSLVSNQNSKANLNRDFGNGGTRLDNFFQKKEDQRSRGFSLDKLFQKKPQIPHKVPVVQNSKLPLRQVNPTNQNNKISNDINPFLNKRPSTPALNNINANNIFGSRAYQINNKQTNMLSLPNKNKPNNVDNNNLVTKKEQIDTKRPNNIFSTPQIIKKEPVIPQKSNIIKQVIRKQNFPKNQGPVRHTAPLRNPYLPSPSTSRQSSFSPFGLNNNTGSKQPIGLNKKNDNINKNNMNTTNNPGNQMKKQLSNNNMFAPNNRATNIAFDNRLRQLNQVKKNCIPCPFPMRIQRQWQTARGKKWSDLQKNQIIQAQKSMNRRNNLNRQNQIWALKGQMNGNINNQKNNQIGDNKNNQNNQNVNKAKNNHPFGVGQSRGGNSFFGGIFGQSTQVSNIYSRPNNQNPFVNLNNNNICNNNQNNRVGNNNIFGNQNNQQQQKK